MVNDHVSDFIARIKNAYTAGNKEVEIPVTKMVVGVANVMQKEGYVESVEVDGKKLIVKLKYEGKKPAIINVMRVSKPGVRRYTSVVNMPKVWGGLGINILSTPKGIISEKSARKMKVGGEIICQVW